MKFRQRRIRSRVDFAFGQNELTYSFRQGSSVREIVFDYFSVKPGRKHTAQRDWSRMQLGLLLAAFGIIGLVAQARLGSFSPWSWAWLAPAAAYLGLFIFTQSHFVVVQADGGPVWIVDDKYAPDISAEIDRRRRDRLAEIYGPLNLFNDPEIEIRKIEWLVGEAVLTRDEADSQIARVKAAQDARAAARAEAEEAEMDAMFAREAIAV